MANINPSSHLNPNSGFGVQANQVGERFINKDGSYNLKKTGLPAWKTMSIYSYMQSIHWTKFLLIIICFYFCFNVLFTFGSLVTGLFYGRATRPKAYLAFSQNAVFAPYRDGKGLMLRVVPYKANHHLTNAKAVVNLALLNIEKQEYEFYSLKLERSRIDSLSMNWTIVHPIYEESPFLNISPEDMEAADIEVSVQITGFDPVFSNTVLARTSYTFKEIIYNAKFVPMYHTSQDGKTTVLELDKLNEYVLL